MNQQPAGDDQAIEPTARAIRQLSPRNQQLVASMVRQLAENEGISAPLSAAPGLQSPIEGVPAQGQRQQEHRRIRTLPVDRDTLGMLRNHIDSNQATSQDDSVPLFGLSRHRAWQIIRDCAGRADLPDLVNPETGRVRGVSPHRLRDAFSVHATKLDDSGDALRLLQEHLGHASFNTTARYRKVAREEHHKWYESLWSKAA